MKPYNILQDYFCVKIYVINVILGPDYKGQLFFLSSRFKNANGTINSNTNNEAQMLWTNLFVLFWSKRTDCFMSIHFISCETKRIRKRSGHVTEQQHTKQGSYIFNQVFPRLLINVLFCATAKTYMSPFIRLIKSLLLCNVR